MSDPLFTVFDVYGFPVMSRASWSEVMAYVQELQEQEPAALDELAVAERGDDGRLIPGTGKVLADLIA